MQCQHRVSLNVNTNRGIKGSCPFESESFLLFELRGVRRRERVSLQAPQTIRKPLFTLKQNDTFLRNLLLPARDFHSDLKTKDLPETVSRTPDKGFTRKLAKASEELWKELPKRRRPSNACTWTRVTRTNGGLEPVARAWRPDVPNTARPLR